MEIRNFILIIFMMLSFSAYASVTTITIVDNNDVPLEGVLVIAEERPFLFTSFKKSVGLSNKNGEIELLDDFDRILIYKPGYYPFVDDSMVPGSPAWAKYEIESSIQLFEVVERTTKIELYDIRVFHEGEAENVILRHNVFSNKVEITYEISSGNIVVTPFDGWKLQRANRFYFDNTKYQNKLTTRELRGKKSISFFLQNQSGELYKALIGNRSSGRISGRHFVSFDIAVSSCLSYENIIYPDIQKWNRYVIDDFLRKGGPKLYMDGDIIELKGKINEYMSPHFLGYPSLFYDIYPKGQVNSTSK